MAGAVSSRGAVPHGPQPQGKVAARATCSRPPTTRTPRNAARPEHDDDRRGRPVGAGTGEHGRRRYTCPPADRSRAGRSRAAERAVACAGAGDVAARPVTPATPTIPSSPCTPCGPTMPARRLDSLAGRFRGQGRSARGPGGSTRRPGGARGARHRERAGVPDRPGRTLRTVVGDPGPAGRAGRRCHPGVPGVRGRRARPRSRVALDLRAQRARVRHVAERHRRGERPRLRQAAGSRPSGGWRGAADDAFEFELLPAPVAAKATTPAITAAAAAAEPTTTSSCRARRGRVANGAELVGGAIERARRRAASSTESGRGTRVAIRSRARIRAARRAAAPGAAASAAVASSSVKPRSAAAARARRRCRRSTARRGFRGSGANRGRSWCS